MIVRDALFADLGYTPHSGQWPVHRSPAKRRVCAMGVRFGKTTLAAFETIAFGLEPRARGVGWIVAPTYELSTRVFREVAHVYLTKLPQLVNVFREHEHLLRVWNLGGGTTEIRGKSADAPVSLLGEGLDFLCVDEVARIRAEIWERHLSQRLVDKDGRALLISTPRGKGWFYELFRRGQSGRDPDYESWNLPSWTNPLLKREIIEADRGRLPEGVFKQEYEAAFVDGAGSVFRNVRDLATGEWRPPVPGATYYAGLDLAKIADYTALVIVDAERRVCHAERFNKIDWELQVGRIKVATERYNEARTLVDSTGAGEPVLESLCRAGINARGYKFTSQSKSDLVSSLAILFEKRALVLPRADLAPELVEELEAFEYSVTDGGTIRTGAPAGQHDDMAIAACLAFWQVRRDDGPAEALWL
jgi:hypothetical protein